MERKKTLSLNKMIENADESLKARSSSIGGVTISEIEHLLMLLRIEV